MDHLHNPNTKQGLGSFLYCKIRVVIDQGMPIHTEMTTLNELISMVLINWIVFLKVDEYTEVDMRGVKWSLSERQSYKFTSGSSFLPVVKLTSGASTSSDKEGRQCECKTTNSSKSTFMCLRGFFLLVGKTCLTTLFYNFFTGNLKVGFFLTQSITSS